MEYYGKNVKDALNNALRILNVKENDIEYEVINKGGIFHKAIIRARVKETTNIFEQLETKPIKITNPNKQYFSPYDGVKDFDEYINFYVDVMNIEKQNNVNSVLNGFEYYDSSDERYVKGRFYYKGNTFVILRNDGSITFSNLMPFVFINPQKKYIHGRMAVDLNEEYYHFDDENDENMFLRYVKEYNEFIRDMIKLAQKKCEQLYNELIQNSEVTNAIQNFLDMIPEIVFVDYELYCTVLHEFCFRDEITKNYLGFSDEESDNAIQVLYRQGNQEAFGELWNLIANLENLIVENFAVDENCINLITYMLINHGLTKRYSDIWKQDYDNTLDADEWQNYIYYCYKQGLLLLEDLRGVTALTYALLKGNKDETVGYRSKFNVIIEELKNAVNQKQKDDFTKKLFSDRQQHIVEKENITIDDIDLMSGAEFEQFICKLFTKMGYSACVTKTSGDQGIDVLADKDGIKIGIQTKCYSNSVGNSAIQEAVAGKQFYACNRVIVITNNFFTKSAIELAAANGVMLWNRDILKEKINEFL